MLQLKENTKQSQTKSPSKQNVTELNNESEDI